MAIPLGTTARQLEAIARWMLACVVVLAVGFWPTPSLAGWGAVTVAMLATLVLWLMHRILVGDGRVPVQAFHWALLLPAVILSVHFVRHHLGARHNAGGISWSGALDVSLLVQVGLLGLGVLLSQSLLPRAARHVGTLAVCGLAMMGGPLMAILIDPVAEPMRVSLGLLACAGVGVWLTPLWGIGRINQPPEVSAPVGASALRWGMWIVAGVAAVVLACVSPVSALLAAGMLGGALALGAAAFGRHRPASLAAGAGLLAACAGGLVWLRAPMPLLPAAGPFGRGGGAFGVIEAGDNGLTVLSATVGWVGAAGLVGGSAVALMWMLLRAGRRRSGDQGRSIIWASTTALATAALLAAGGLFAPAMTVAAGFVWGMAPRALGRPRRDRSGWALLAATVLAMLVVGVAPVMGLVEWSVGELVSLGSTDEWLHAASGLLLALMVGWLLGRRRAWFGVVGIVIVAAAGGAGELMQRAVGSGRSLEWSDWAAHAIGSAGALALYGLCMLARRCESAEAVSMEAKLAAYDV